MTELAALLAGLVAGLLAAGLWERQRRRNLQKQLEEARRRLEAARTARETFFDLTTHELRSPLSAILGYQELLHDGAYGELGDEARDATARLGRAARHLLNLIDGVLELSRMANTEVRIKPEDVDLAVVFAAATEAFTSHARDRGLKPAVEITGPLPTIPTDSRRLVRALDLMVTSAVRHPAETAMTMTVRPEEDGVSASIAPTCIQVDANTDDPAVRLGIRLAVALRIGELLGGGLDLDLEDGCARRITFRVRGTRPSAGL